jgi:hypothetical protein
MEQSVSSETDKLYNWKETARLLWTRNVHYRSQESAANTFPEQLSPTHNLAPYISMSHLVKF